MRYSKVIFVSEDDTYSSPVAAALLAKQMSRYNISVESKGMVVLFNEPANPKGVSILKEMGYDISKHMSTQLGEQDFGIDTLILVMSEKGKRDAYANYKKSVNVYTIKEFVGSSGDVEVPYGRGIEEYKDNIDKLNTIVMQVAEKLILG